MARILVSCGAHLVDTDAIARSLTVPDGAAMPLLAAAFGPQAIAADGSLNRDHMRQLVFQDRTARSRLEAILHPLIGQSAARAAALAIEQPIVFDVPLLAESSKPGGWRSRLDRVLVIDCEEATQIVRVAQRPGWNAALARHVVAQQASRAQRRAIADALVFNESLSLQALETEVRTVWAIWTSRPEP